MGQDISKGCSCGEAAEDPTLEHRTLSESKDGHRTESVAPKQATAPAVGGGRVASTTSGGAVQASANPWGEQDDQDGGFFIPPPPSDLDPHHGAAAPAPAHHEEHAHPASATAPTRAAAPAAASASAHGPVDLEVLLSDLEGAEASIYGEAFARIAGGGGSAQTDNAQLRDFVAANTAIVPGELDTELLKIASMSETFSIDLNGFLRILRENSVAEGDALEQFLGLTSTGEDISSEDCRSGLLNLMQQKLRSHLSEDKLNRAFDAVMVDAGLTVTMEQWVAYCKRAARVARLAKLVHA